MANFGLFVQDNLNGIFPHLQLEAGARRKYEYKVWRRHEGEDNVNIEVATELFFSNVLSKVESQHQQQVL